MRALVRLALIQDPTLITLGVVPEGVFAGDVDTPDQRPFLQLRWSNTTPGVDVVSRRDLVIWVHDNAGDYERIDSVIRRIKTIMSQLVGVPHAAGYLMVCEWTGDSADLTDDGHGTITRTTSFSIVGTGQ